MRNVNILLTRYDVPESVAWFVLWLLRRYTLSVDTSWQLLQGEITCIIVFLPNGSVIHGHFT